MYIQIETVQKKKEERKMRLVKQKPEIGTKSPRARRIAGNEATISDVSDVEPAPNTGINMLKLNLKFEDLETVLDKY